MWLIEKMYIKLGLFQAVFLFDKNSNRKGLLDFRLCQGQLGSLIITCKLLLSNHNRSHISGLDIMNYGFLSTETNLKALYISGCLFTTSSVKLFVVNVKIFLYNCVFRKKVKIFTKHFIFWKWKLIPETNMFISLPMSILDLT